MKTKTQKKYLLVMLLMMLCFSCNSDTDGSSTPPLLDPCDGRNLISTDTKKMRESQIDAEFNAYILSHYKATDKDTANIEKYVRKFNSDLNTNIKNYDSTNTEISKEFIQKAYNINCAKSQISQIEDSVQRSKWMDILIGYILSDTAKLVDNGGSNNPNGNGSNGGSNNPTGNGGSNNPTDNGSSNNPTSNGDDKEIKETEAELRTQIADKIKELEKKGGRTNQLNALNTALQSAERINDSVQKKILLFEAINLKKQ